MTEPEYDITRKSRPIVIVDYQDQWPKEFREIGARIRETLGDDALRIDHIGSTSVAGEVSFEAFSSVESSPMLMLLPLSGSEQALETRAAAASSTMHLCMDILFPQLVFGAVFG